MDKINFRFLNYKKYNSFKTALNDGRILDDSIVFIKDKQCIWARGKEYICDGPYTTSTDNNGNVTLTKGDGTLIFRIGLKDGIISITDGNGNINKASYATKEYVDDNISSKQDKLYAGDGISIDGTVISSTLDTDVYEFISELGSTYNMNPNKIYILEVKIDDAYVYKQYKIKDGQWVMIGDVAPTVNLDGYLKRDDLLPYAPIQYVEDTFVKKSQVYSYGEGGSSGDGQSGDSGSSGDDWNTGGGSGGGTSFIIVDKKLSYISPNPVENRVITEALQTKATLTQVAEKLDRLTAGKGIKIVDNIISTDLNLDTSIYAIVDELPLAGASENKIYLLRKSNSDASWKFGDPLPATYSDGIISDYEYTQYKWDNQNKQWIKIGDVTPTVNLSEYVSKEDAKSYATKLELQLHADYALNMLQEYIDYSEDKLQEHADYAEDRYVQKQSLYTEDSGVDGPNNPTLDTDDIGIVLRSVVNTVFLTKQQYQALVNMNLVKDDVYYFTYEGDNELETWAFGGTFPITLT